MKTLLQILFIFILLSCHIHSQSSMNIIVSSSGVRPNLAVDQKGNAHIVWEEKIPNGNSYDLYPYYASYDSLGSIVHAGTIIMNEQYDRYPSIITGKEDFLCLFNYKHPNSPESYAFGKLIDYSGSTSGTIIDLWQGESPSGCVFGDRDYAVVWVNEDIIRLQCSRDSVSIFYLLIAKPSTSTILRFPQILKSKQQTTTTLIWSDEHSRKNDIKAQIFNSDWSPNSSQVLINEDSLVTGIFYFSAAMDDSGKFTIVYSGSKNGIWQIYRRMFDSGGTSLGNEEVISGENDNVNEYASVGISVNDKGESIVAWEGTINNAANIFLRRYDQFGKLIGESINCSQSSISNFEPRVILINKKIYIAWWETDASANSGVLLKVMDFNNPLNSIAEKNDLSTKPSSFFLFQNYPNPFNPSTRISYTLADVSNIEITIFDAMGKQVKVLRESNLASGEYGTTWDGTNEYGMKVSSGIYLYHFKVQAANGMNVVYRKSGKMVLVK